MIQTLVYLSAKNAGDDIFLREFSGSFQLPGKTLLLHSPASPVSEPRFLTKRISGFLSENMVANTGYSGDQRGLLTLQDNRILLRRELLEILFQNSRCIILNSLTAVNGGESILLDAVPVLRALAAELRPQAVILFPDNPLSPLGKIPEQITVDTHAKLLGAFEEEKNVLDLAEKISLLAPAWIASATNFFPGDSKN